MSFSMNMSMSLYIPRVFPNITQERITGVFEDLNFGVVSHVDLVNKESSDGRPYNSAYVHFKEWTSSSTNASFQERVRDPARDARVVYDDPWYWIVLENKGKKHVPGDRKPRIEITDRPPADENTALVSADYVTQIENENHRLRTQVAHLEAMMRTPSIDSRAPDMGLEPGDD